MLQDFHVSNSLYGYGKAGPTESSRLVIHAPVSAPAGVAATDGQDILGLKNVIK